MRRVVVVTNYCPNPPPQYDKWSAQLEGVREYERNDFVGYGSTEAEAVQNLYECISEAEEADEVQQYGSRR